MAWIYLVLGGILEVFWVVGLKYIDSWRDFSILLPTVLALGISFWLFAKVLQMMPVSTAYAIYTGLGAFGTAVAGMAFLGDGVSLAKILLLLTLIGCIIALKVVD